MSEIEIQHSIMRDWGATGIMRIWRQNVGMGYAYHQVRSLIGLVAAAQIGKAIAFTKTMRPINYGVPGQPDIMGILIDGRAIGIEVKTSTGRQSPEQKNYQQMMEKFGGLYILARSSEDVRAALAAEGYAQ